MSNTLPIVSIDVDDRILISELVERIYKECPEVLYHYTSSKSAEMIKKSKVIYFGDSRQLADNSEQKDIFEILRNLANLCDYPHTFKTYLQTISSHKYLDKFLQVNAASFDIPRFFVFSCSPDKCSDYLISHYSKNGDDPGCRITINVKGLEESYYSKYLEVVPIIYDKSDKEKLVNLIVDHALEKFNEANSDDDQLTIIGTMVSYLMYAGIYMKNESFSKESEVRILLVECEDTARDLRQYRIDEHSRYELPIVEKFCSEFLYL